jgi:hypothetical protein
VKVTVRRVLSHRRNKVSMMTPLTSLCRGNRRTLIKAKDITEVLRNVMRINVHRTGIKASEISARSLRAGGAMASLHGRVNLSNIRMMGRWHRYTMLWYLHFQAEPILGNFAAHMFNEGNYSFLLDETIPIIYNYEDDI